MVLDRTHGWRPIASNGPGPEIRLSDIREERPRIRPPECPTPSRDRDPPTLSAPRASELVAPQGDSFGVSRFGRRVLQSHLIGTPDWSRPESGRPSELGISRSGFPDRSSATRVAHSTSRRDVPAGRSIAKNACSRRRSNASRAAERPLLWFKNKLSFLRTVGLASLPRPRGRCFRDARSPSRSTRCLFPGAERECHSC